MMYSRFHELLIILDRALFDFGSHVMVLQSTFPNWQTTSSPSGFIAMCVFIGLICVVVVVTRRILRSIRRQRWHGADRRPGREWVRGTAQIVAVQVLYAGRTTGRNGEQSKYQLDIVLQGPGISPTAVRDIRWVKSQVWPNSRMTVPVMIDPTNPKKFAFLWDELPPPPADTGAQRARDLQDRLRSAQPDQRQGQVAPDPFAAPRGMLAAAAAAASTSDTSIAETSPRLGASAAAPSAPLIESSNWSPTGAGKRIVYDALATMQPGDALKALTALHDRGLLTEAEFADQKSRLAL